MSLVTCPLFDVSKMDHRGAVLPGTIFLFQVKRLNFKLIFLVSKRALQNQQTVETRQHLGSVLLWAKNAG